MSIEKMSCDSSVSMKTNIPADIPVKRGKSVRIKKTKKILNWFLGGIILTYILLTIFPSFLFVNKLKYKNFSVYYHYYDLM